MPMRNLHFIAALLLLAGCGNRNDSVVVVTLSSPSPVDVASVRTEGVDFAYPSYLENIVRQIALRFHPARNTSARAEVMFLIRRDGSVTGFQFLTRSGNFEFDLEAQGAVDQAGQVKAFGPLPSGFADDVLPVIFSFDPRFLH